MSKHVGKAIPHESAKGHVTGVAKYTDDLVPRYAGTLHAWPVQSPHAHARVNTINTSAAIKLPGVVCVLTGRDVPEGGNPNTGPARQDEELFPQVALFHGHAVAWVLAEDIEAAIQGAAAVVVDYEVLPAIVTIEQAIEEDSFHTQPSVIVRGEPESALASATHRHSGELFENGQEHFYLETQVALAYVDEDDHVFVHSSTQHPTETQMIVARVLGLRHHEVAVQSLRMGGAFGGKEVQANTWAAIAALGAIKTGRPVRVRLDRMRDMEMTGKRHPFLGRYEVGFDDEGHITALDVKLFSDGGYSLDLSAPVMDRALFHIDNAYYLPNLSVVGRVVNTHKTSQTAFRGFGGPQGMLVVEEAIDHVARTLGMRPELVRERNFYKEGHTTHYGMKVKDADRVDRVWDELKRSSQFDERVAALERFNASNPNTKRGIAITPVKFGISFTTAFFNQAGALVLIYQDGTVQVNHGGTEMGQGLHTKMLQVAAQALSVPLDSVRMMPTRTDKVPNTSATAASAGTDLNGAAVKDACAKLRTRIAETAGQLFGCHPEEVIWEEGELHSFEDPSKRATFAEVVKKAYLSRVPLFAQGYYRTPKIHYDAKAGRGKPFHYFAYGAAVSEVEVDGFTGQYTIRRVDILHDVGDSISPLVDRGQVEGGFAQGVGWLTTEELVWNDDGRLATRGASTYKLPTLGECPEVFNVTLLDRAAEDGVIHGSKAVGEPPFMLAMSAREALRDAVAAFGSGGATLLGCPSTPEAVYWAIEEQRAEGGRRKRAAAEEE